MMPPLLLDREHLGNDTALLLPPLEGGWYFPAVLEGASMRIHCTSHQLRSLLHTSAIWQLCRLLVCEMCSAWMQTGTTAMINLAGNIGGRLMSIVGSGSGNRHCAVVTPMAVQLVQEASIYHANQEKMSGLDQEQDPKRLLQTSLSTLLQPPR